MDFDEVVAQLKKIYESDPVQYEKIVDFIRRVQGFVKIQKATKKNEKYFRFSISRKRYGEGRVKYVALGKILKENYNSHSEEVDILTNTGDVGSLISKEYFILSEEKSILQGKITDFYQK